MNVFLLWRRIDDPNSGPDSKKVVKKLGEIFAPLFEHLPAERIHSTPTARLAYLELPVRRWCVPLIEREKTCWSFAPEYPVNARIALESNGSDPGNGSIVPSLCRNLQKNPTPFLKDLAPPFSLIWSDENNGETFVQNDGLGQAQLFEFEHDGLWAVTNKLFALNALGASLELDAEQWAVRFALGWFPLEMSGFKSVRFVPPGTQLRLSKTGVHRKSIDVISDWVSPEPMSKQDCHEMARASLIEFIEQAKPLWQKPGAGLSGGWDSRAVVASLRASGVRYSARVRGHVERPDVIIASRLAEIAGIKLKISTSGGLPAGDSEGCRQSINKALLWQSGQLTTHKHISFLAGKKHLAGGSVNVMGAAGEICRGYYLKKIKTARWEPAKAENHFIKELTSRFPPYLTEKMRDLSQEVILAAYRRAASYQIAGLRRLDFFYLFERTRRWCSGALGAQPGQAITPFLNPDLIRATFSYPVADLVSSPFHRHVIAIHAPEWSEIPIADDIAAGIPPRQDRDSEWHLPVANEVYDRQLHWREVGESLINDALDRGGYWNEIFDHHAARGQWHKAPDALAIFHQLSHTV